MDGQVVFSLLMVCGIILFSILSLSLILSVSSYYFVKTLTNSDSKSKLVCVLVGILSFLVMLFIAWVNFGAGVACTLLGWIREGYINAITFKY